MTYPLKALASVVVTLAAYLFNWLFALFVQSDGNLPRWLKWFQPSDNLAIGDALWKAEHPDYSDYMLALSYMNRNPAQGFDQFLQANVSETTPVKVRGNLYIRVGPKGIGGWYLITSKDYFHLTYVLPMTWFGEFCITGGFGWRLVSIAKGYHHDTLGQLVFTPFRFHQFYK